MEAIPSYGTSPLSSSNGKMILDILSSLKRDLKESREENRELRYKMDQIIGKQQAQQAQQEQVKQELFKVRRTIESNSISSDGGYAAFQIHANNAEEFGIPPTKTISPLQLRSRSPTSARRYPVEKWVPNELDPFEDPGSFSYDDFDDFSQHRCNRGRARSISFEAYDM